MDLNLKELVQEIVNEALDQRELRRDVKTEFIERYVTTFLATWAANNYVNACAEDRHDKLAESAPLEDAHCLANQAWERVSTTKYGASV